MELQKIVSALDAHAGGQPVRLLTKPFSHRTPAELLAICRHAPLGAGDEALDALARLVLTEPRGHAAMSACLVLDPIQDTSDISVVFFNNRGYVPFSGHSLIGLVTALIETGGLPAWSPGQPVRIDTPVGTVSAEATLAGSEVTHISYEHVPSFVVDPAVSIQVDGTPLLAAVVFSGRFYAVVDGSTLGLRPNLDDLPRLQALESAIRAAVEAQMGVVHPVLSDIRGLTGVLYTFADPSSPTRIKTVAVCDGIVNRSPGGTALAAVLALGVAAGDFNEGTVLTCESIVGSQFVGRVVGKTQVGEYSAIRPEVTGSGFLTGVMQFALDPSDPLADGFLLR